MKELVLGIAIVIAAIIVACALRFTPILANADSEGVLDRWTGRVVYPWSDECHEEDYQQNIRLPALRSTAAR